MPCTAPLGDHDRTKQDAETCKILGPAPAPQLCLSTGSNSHLAPHYCWISHLDSDPDYTYWFLGLFAMQIVKFLIKYLQSLGLWEEVSFHLGFPTELQRCGLLPPARFVSPSCKHTCTYIISSVCAVSLSQGVFPLGNLITSCKVSGQRPERPPSLLVALEKAPQL